MRDLVNSFERVLNVKDYKEALRDQLERTRLSVSYDLGSLCVSRIGMYTLQQHPATNQWVDRESAGPTASVVTGNEVGACICGGLGKNFIVDSRHESHPFALLSLFVFACVWSFA